MNAPLTGRCPVCGGELIAETSTFYLQAVCQSCRVCLEFPRQIAHDVEELDGVLAMHAQKKSEQGVSV